MKRIILLMVLVLVFLSVIVAAENLCEKYGIKSEECSRAVEIYTTLQQNSKLIKACTGKTGGCVDQSARAIVFGDRPLQENERRALTQLRVEATTNTKFYQVREKLYSPPGLKALDPEAIAPPDKSETDEIIKTYQKGIPVQSGNLGYIDFEEGLGEHLNPSGMVKMGSGISLIGYRESHLPTGLTSAEEKAVKQAKAKVWLEEIAATIAELGRDREKPLPDNSVASLELSREQLETALPKIKNEQGPDAYKAAQELIRAIDFTTSRFQPPDVKLQKLQQRLNELDAIDNPTPEEEEEANALMEQMDKLEQVKPSQVGRIAVNLENLGKKVDWLKCPDGCDYKVQKGDSYWSLAKRIPDADIKMEALMEMNEGKPLIAGITTIRIPSKDEFLGYVFKKEKYFSPFQCRG